MDNNINNILKTDKKARERLEKARENAFKLRQQLDSDIEKIKEKSALKSEKIKEELKIDEERKIKTASEEIERSAKKIRKNLNERYEENHDKWVNEIVKRALS